MPLRPASTCRGRRCRRPSLHRERVAPSRGGRPWRARGCRPRRRRSGAVSGIDIYCLLTNGVAYRTTSYGTKSVRRNPDEARDSLADPLGCALVRPPPKLRPVRPEHEHAGVSLGHQLEERVDRMRAAYTQPLDAHRERVGELGRLAAARAGDPRSRCSRTRRGSSGLEGSRRHSRRRAVVRLSTAESTANTIASCANGTSSVARSTGRVPPETSETSSRGPLRRRVGMTIRGGVPSAVRRAPCGGTGAASTEGRRTARRPSRAERVRRSVRSRRRSAEREPRCTAAAMTSTSILWRRMRRMQALVLLGRNLLGVPRASTRVARPALAIGTRFVSPHSHVIVIGGLAISESIVRRRRGSTAPVLNLALQGVRFARAPSLTTDSCTKGR